MTRNQARIIARIYAGTVVSSTLGRIGEEMEHDDATMVEDELKKLSTKILGKYPMIWTEKQIIEYVTNLTP